MEVVPRQFCARDLTFHARLGCPLRRPRDRRLCLSSVFRAQPRLHAHASSAAHGNHSWLAAPVTMGSRPAAGRPACVDHRLGRSVPLPPVRAAFWRVPPHGSKHVVGLPRRLRGAEVPGCASCDDEGAAFRSVPRLPPPVPQLHYRNSHGWRRRHQRSHQRPCTGSCIPIISSGFATRAAEDATSKPTVGGEGPRTTLYRCCASRASYRDA